MTIEERERKLAERERAIREKEREIEEREAGLENKPYSRRLQAKKELWYDKVPLSVKQLDVIIWVVSIALVIVFVLIILEAAGIFKL